MAMAVESVFPALLFVCVLCCVLAKSNEALYWNEFRNCFGIVFVLLRIGHFGQFSSCSRTVAFHHAIRDWMFVMCVFRSLSLSGRCKTHTHTPHICSCWFLYYRHRLNCVCFFLFFNFFDFAYRPKHIFIFAIIQIAKRHATNDVCHMACHGMTYNVWVCECVLSFLLPFFLLALSPFYMKRTIRSNKKNIDLTANRFCYRHFS